jgi:tetratricopeptide (TPR) repeat protein
MTLANTVLKPMSRWNKFPHNNADFLYKGDQLLESWPDLHRGDRVEFPDAEWVERVLDESPDAAPRKFDDDFAALAVTVQDAWRCFHAGDFQQAVSLSEKCGHLAHAPANKAAGVYATYLEPDASKQQACYLAAIKQAESAIEILPDDPNSHYFHAFNLGRYSQSISVIKALSQGIGGKIHTSLQNALELEPDHAEAHTAMGMYHAEIINKVGKMLGKMTYGASAAKALEHFERALELTPDSPIAHIEYGNGLYLLFDDGKLDEVTDLYVRASELQPADAMEKLDVEAALAELE